MDGYHRLLLPCVAVAGVRGARRGKRGWVVICGDGMRVGVVFRVWDGVVWLFFVVDRWMESWI